jgi:hypothetical protein
MKIAIMQPYFLPYIGYFQLINAVDKFVVYDNIEYTKKGWINRNRFLLNKNTYYFTIPLKHDSDYLFIKERSIANDFKPKKIIAQINNAYRNAPFYNKVMPIFELIIYYEKKKLFDYIFNSVLLICEYLEIKTNLIVSSSLNINHSLKSQEKVIAICKETGTKEYINSKGGIELYNKNDFLKENIILNFLKTNDIQYKQFDNEFIQNLSILDVCMFNSKEQIQKYLTEFSFYEV